MSKEAVSAYLTLSSVKIYVESGIWDELPSFEDFAVMRIIRTELAADALVVGLGVTRTLLLLGMNIFSSGSHYKYGFNGG